VEPAVVLVVGLDVAAEQLLDLRHVVAAAATGAGKEVVALEQLLGLPIDHVLAD